jgi:hypothetical protein
MTMARRSIAEARNRSLLKQAEHGFGVHQLKLVANKRRLKPARRMRLTPVTACFSRLFKRKKTGTKFGPG